MNVTPAELAAILRRDGYAVNQFDNVVEIADGNVSDAQPGELADTDVDTANETLAFAKRWAEASKKPRRTSEHDEQVALFQWADMAQGEHPELAMLFAVPNGGQRHPAVAAQLKAEGVRAGVPDVFLPVARGRWHGLFIEMKVKPNKATEAQVEWIDNLRRYGFSAVICYGAQDAINIIQAYLAQDGTR